MFSDPEHNVGELGLAEGAHVVDFGAGSGFCTMAAARVVGGQGKVFAVDIQKDLLSKIKNTAEEQHLMNIEVVWGDIEKVGGVKLRDSFADAAIASNILFQVDDKRNFVKEIRRLLKKTGKVLVVDWTDSFNGMGPEPKAVVPEIAARNLFEAEGFRYERTFGAGDHHYGLIFKYS